MVCVQTAKIAPLHAVGNPRGAMPAHHKSLAGSLMRSHMSSSDTNNIINNNNSNNISSSNSATKLASSSDLHHPQGKGLDSQLWHACAGNMVQLPPVGAKVIYFPQGHGEQAAVTPDFPRSLSPTGTISCRVISVDFLADSETDEVYAKLKLQPDVPSPFGCRLADDEDPVSSPAVEKPASFAKTLTQSDANNGGGFSVPRYCAETIFPRLDYSVDPPVQTVLAKDVHGAVWKFRHIYRGTPRRHLLTTGWSTFVNQKKLVAGDAIVFLRSATGELCVGVRRSMRGPGGGDSGVAWHSSPGQRAGNSSAQVGSSRWELKVENGFSEMISGASGGGGGGGASFARNRARVTTKSVLEAASLAAAGQAFEVVYYPRASTAEFCVRASVVKASLGHGWYPGMRFKMAFETEDSSRISWFMGTISAVQAADPIRWTNSPWRILQVSWDEPDLLQGVNRVSPWQVELVSTLPMQLPPFSVLPRKKFRSSSQQPLEVQFGDHHHQQHHPGGGGFMGLPMATLASTVLGQLNPWQQSLSEELPAGMQGARHERFFGLTLSEFQPKHQQQQHHHQQQQQQQRGGLFLDGGAYPLDHSSRGATEINLNNNLTPHDFFQVQNFLNSGSNRSYGVSAAAAAVGGGFGSGSGFQVEAAAAAAVTPPVIENPKKRSAAFVLFGKSIDPYVVSEPPPQKQNSGGGSSSEGNGNLNQVQQQEKESSPPAQPSSNSSFDDSQAETNNNDNNNNNDGNKTTHKFFHSSSANTCSIINLQLCQGESPDSGVTNESGCSKWIKEQASVLSCEGKETILAPQQQLQQQDQDDDDHDNVIHCKIFFEKEEVGRTLDLSLFGNYEELYDKLAIMFTVEKSQLSGRVVYRDVEGSTIHIGGEPYRNFMSSVRRLTILALPSDSTGSRSAQSW